MGDLKTSILYENDIDVLGHKYDFLKHVNPDNTAFKDWKYVTKHNKGYTDIKRLNIIFIGQTGYGKSSLINRLLGINVFKTSDCEACTKSLQSADYFLHHKFIEDKLAYTLSFVDLPGIGENNKSDDLYLKWYAQYVNAATIILYLFRADKRDYSQDEFFFSNVFNKSMSKNLLCILSQADKMEPINRLGNITIQQLTNIEKKKSEILSKSFLHFYKNDIVHVSALLNDNINKLHNIIISKIKCILYT